MKTCKKTLIAAIIVLSGVLSSATFANSPEDFDDLCNLIHEAAVKTRSLKQQSAYITNNLRQRVASEDVIEAYRSLGYVDPADRYTVFKQAAENTLNRQWECAPMKTLLEPVAENANG